MAFDLILATQYSFMVAFVGMSGGALYFSQIRSSLPPAWQGAAASSSVICYMAAIVYAYINYKYGIGTDALKTGHYPTELRYVDWLITTPLIVHKFPELLGDDASAPSIAVLVMVADVLMILFGFAGETSINAAKSATTLGWTMFGISSVAWLFIIYVLFTSVSRAAATKLRPIQVGLRRLKLFIVVGWLFYPLGFLLTLVSNAPELRVTRELVYNFADLFNKVGFGAVALYSVQQMLREAEIRRAISSL